MRNQQDLEQLVEQAAEAYEKALFKKALQLYQQAVSKGSARAKTSLAVMYYHGQGVARDLRQAYALFLDAAIHGHVRGMINLGQMNQSGHAVEYKSLDRARFWYQLALRQPDKRHQEAILKALAESKEQGEHTENKKTAVIADQRALEDIERFIKSWQAIRSEVATHQFDLDLYVEELTRNPWLLKMASHQSICSEMASRVSEIPRYKIDQESVLKAFFHIYQCTPEDFATRFFDQAAKNEIEIMKQKAQQAIDQLLSEQQEYVTQQLSSIQKEADQVFAKIASLDPMTQEQAIKTEIERTLADKLSHVFNSPTFQAFELKLAENLHDKIRKEHEGLQAQMAELINKQDQLSGEVAPLVQSYTIQQIVVKEKAELVAHPVTRAMYQQLNRLLSAKLIASINLISEMVMRSQTKTEARAQTVAKVAKVVLGFVPFGGVLAHAVGAGQAAVELYMDRKVVRDARSALQNFNGVNEIDQFAELLARRMTQACSEWLRSSSIDVNKIDKKIAEISEHLFQCLKYGEIEFDFDSPEERQIDKIVAQIAPVAKSKFSMTSSTGLFSGTNQKIENSNKWQQCYSSISALVDLSELSCRVESNKLIVEFTGSSRLNLVANQIKRSLLTDKETCRVEGCNLVAEFSDNKRALDLADFFDFCLSQVLSAQLVN